MIASSSRAQSSGVMSAAPGPRPPVEISRSFRSARAITDTVCSGIGSTCARVGMRSLSFAIAAGSPELVLDFRFKTSGAQDGFGLKIHYWLPRRSVSPRYAGRRMAMGKADDAQRIVRNEENRMATIRKRTLPSGLVRWQVD